MPIEKIVLNASPIIILYKAQMENILPQLFNDIIIPKSVFDEITKARIKDRAKVELPKQAWYKKVKIGIDDAIAGWDLGKGESSVLSFALKNKK
jgi:predicted nucleic acid-binding protein